jgi:hypothetical protein
MEVNASDSSNEAANGVNPSQDLAQDVSFADHFPTEGENLDSTGGEPPPYASSDEIPNELKSLQQLAQKLAERTPAVVAAFWGGLREGVREFKQNATNIEGDFKGTSPDFIPEHSPVPYDEKSVPGWVGHTIGAIFTALPNAVLAPGGQAVEAKRRALNEGANWKEVAAEGQKGYALGLMKTASLALGREGAALTTGTADAAQKAQKGEIQTPEQLATAVITGGAGSYLADRALGGLLKGLKGLFPLNRAPEHTAPPAIQITPTQTTHVPTPPQVVKIETQAPTRTAVAPASQTVTAQLPPKVVEPQTPTPAASDAKAEVETHTPKHPRKGLFPDAQPVPVEGLGHLVEARRGPVHAVMQLKFKEDVLDENPDFFKEIKEALKAADQKLADLAEQAKLEYPKEEITDSFLAKKYPLEDRKAAITSNPGNNIEEVAYLGEGVENRAYYISIQGHEMVVKVSNDVGGPYPETTQKMLLTENMRRTFAHRNGPKVYEIGETYFAMSGLHRAKLIHGDTKSLVDLDTLDPSTTFDGELVDIERRKLIDIVITPFFPHDVRTSVERSEDSYLSESINDSLYDYVSSPETKRYLKFWNFQEDYMGSNIAQLSPMSQKMREKSGIRPNTTYVLFDPIFYTKSSASPSEGKLKPPTSWLDRK